MPDGESRLSVVVPGLGLVVSQGDVAHGRGRTAFPILRDLPRVRSALAVRWHDVSFDSLARNLALAVRRVQSRRLGRGRRGIVAGVLGIVREAGSFGERVLHQDGRNIRKLAGVAVFLTLGGCETREPAGLDAGAARDATYVTEFRDAGHVTLRDGEFAEPVAEGSASMLPVRLELVATGDLDGNGSADIAAVLVTHPGGSGVFSTLHGLVERAGRLHHAGSVLLGDRVHVRSVRIDGAIVTVRLLDRPDAAPFARAPSVPVTRRFAVRNGGLVEVASL